MSPRALPALPGRNTDRFFGSTSAGPMSSKGIINGTVLASQIHWAWHPRFPGLTMCLLARSLQGTPTGGRVRSL